MAMQPKEQPAACADESVACTPARTLTRLARLAWVGDGFEGTAARSRLMLKEAAIVALCLLPLALSRLMGPELYAR